MVIIRRLGTVAAIGAMALLAPADASAQTATKLWTGCNGTNFITCASVQLDLVGTLATIRVMNLAGMDGTYEGSIFTAIGFDNLNLAVAASQDGDDVTTMSGPYIEDNRGAGPDPWVAKNSGSGTTIGGLQLEFAGTTDNGVDDGIASDCALEGQLPNGANNFWMSNSAACAGYHESEGLLNGMSTNDGWVVFSFNLANYNLSSQQLQLAVDGSTLAIQVQNGPNGNSTQFICAEGECVNVVPEPITMALLGTGLAGIGGMKMRRKRKETDLE